MRDWRDWRVKVNVGPDQPFVLLGVDTNLGQHTCSSSLQLACGVRRVFLRQNVALHLEDLMREGKKEGEVL